MRISSILTLTAVSFLVLNHSAEAVPIAFSTTGTFSSPTGGCTAAAANTITCDGYTLTFTSTPTSEDVPLGFSSVVNFGQVTTTGSSTSVINGGGTFSLQVTQTIPAPTGGSPFTYSASLVAQLVLSASNSFLQFSAPLSRTVTGAPYDVVYNLTEADDAVPGRSRISGSGQAPLDINGSITPTAIPEPASLTLFGSGLLALARRRLKKA